MNILRKAMKKEIEELKPVLFSTYNAIADYKTNRNTKHEKELRKLIRKTALKMKPFIPYIYKYKQRFIKALLSLEETELSIREEIFLLDEAVAEMHIRLRRDRTPQEKNQPWTSELLNLLNNKRNMGNKQNYSGEKNKSAINNRPNKIEGLGIDTGNVEGKIQIILDGNNFSQLKKDRILVTKMTNPGLFSYFGRLKGIITEQGGRLCHAAILAREFDIPCIVGCQNAAEILKDEEIVKLNSGSGVIFLS